FQEGLRDTANPFNTFSNPGLPIGPITNPGALTIEAALRPVAGKWLYFVAINLNTGETIFSDTLAEHEKAADIYRQWCRDNPNDVC
ncbi:MAG: ABC transporter substrate-binding protein, partial [Micrococcales bacterium]|nr:ABC transporter substrate-binding protein [Micrococcales bacterium]